MATPESNHTEREVDRERRGETQGRRDYSKMET